MTSKKMKKIVNLEYYNYKSASRKNYQPLKSLYTLERHEQCERPMAENPSDIYCILAAS